MTTATANSPWKAEKAANLAVRDIIWIEVSPRYILEARREAKTIEITTITESAAVHAEVAIGRGTPAEDAIRSRARTFYLDREETIDRAKRGLPELWARAGYRAADRLSTMLVSDAPVPSLTPASLAAQVGAAIGPDPHTADVGRAVAHISWLLDPMANAEETAHRLLLTAAMSLTARTLDAAGAWSDRLLTLCGEALSDRADSARLTPDR